MTEKDSFEKETGMSLDEAWAKVREWHFAGKNEEAKNGCKLILRFFPDHEAKDLYKKLKGGKDGPIEKATDTVLGMFQKAKQGIKGEQKGVDQKMPQQKEDSFLEKESKKKKSFGLFSTSRPREIDPSLPEESTLEDNERLFAAIGYFWFLFLIPLLAKKESKFVQYHAKQGMVITGIVTIGALLLPFPSLFLILRPFYVILMAVLAWIAWDGKYLEIPLISNLARKITI
jgi:uncharacterized membrane protein